MPSLSNMKRRLPATGYGSTRLPSQPKERAATRICHQSSPSHHSDRSYVATYLVPLYYSFVYDRFHCSRMYIDNLLG